MPPAYLRMAVTARCNLACRYCVGGACEMSGCEADRLMPATFAFLARCAAAEGIRKVRLTGGEPLIREDLEEIVRAVGAAERLAKVTLTTNGIGLAGRARALADAGLSSANVSLDTLTPPRFAALTGRDLLGEVIEGIDAAAEALETVKINTVLIRGMNGDEVGELVRFAVGRGLRIRFIERYGANASADGDLTVTEAKSSLEAEFGELVPAPADRLSVEQVFRLPSLGNATVGLISSRTRPPCETCNKLRFTAEAQLRGCLFDDRGESIAAALENRDEAAVRSALRRVFAAKKRIGGAKPWVGSPVRLVGG